MDATTFSFWTPAQQIDFPDDAERQAALESRWNLNLGGFTRQAIAGNPWNATNASGITHYFDPSVTPPPPDAKVASITWEAFPGRIGFYFPSLPEQTRVRLADTGYQESGRSFPPITSDPCSGQPINLAYGPYGPRGWQDEYCEWSVTRNDSGKIVRVDFTCENPEYWNTLWSIDPQRVLDLYRSTLDKPQIQLGDLCLYDANQRLVIDPSTGRPAYNALNKWNSGPHSLATAGGAMHLTSTPNTLQTEIGLAGAATIQRQIGSSDPNRLICCAQYGQPHRNSDPHIGQVTNQLVGLGNRVTLTNPPGLYIQMPDFSSYRAPDGADPASFWTIVRGTRSLNDASGRPLPGNFILHAAYQVPAARGYTVSDISIGGQPIAWGAQIAQTFLMQIVATAASVTAPAPVACVGTPPVSRAQPLQLFHASVFEAMAAQAVSNPMQQPMNLLSNSTLIAPCIEQGATAVPMVLTAATVSGSEPPNVSFGGDDRLGVTVTRTAPVSYAVPGNSYPATCVALYLQVSVSPIAAPGLRGVYVTSSAQLQGPPMPALLNVVPKGSIRA